MTPKITAATKRRPKATAVARAKTAEPLDASPDAATPLAAGERACPTRLDGASPLFQHRLTTSQCQSKQRGMYHKCFTCAHSNARS